MQEFNSSRLIPPPHVHIDGGPGGGGDWRLGSALFRSIHSAQGEGIGAD